MHTFTRRDRTLFAETTPLETIHFWEKPHHWRLILCMELLESHTLLTSRYNFNAIYSPFLSFSFVMLVSFHGGKREKVLVLWNQRFPRKTLLKKKWRRRDRGGALKRYRRRRESREKKFLTPLPHYKFLNINFPGFFLSFLLRRNRVLFVPDLLFLLWSLFFHFCREKQAWKSENEEGERESKRD